MCSKTTGHTWPMRPPTADRPDGGLPFDGDPCRCGSRRWNDDSPGYSGPTGPAPQSMPRRGSIVRLASMPDEPVVVDEVDRGLQMVRIGAKWYELTDIQR